MTPSSSRFGEAWRWFSRPWRSPALLLSLVAAFAAPVVMTSSADLFAVAAGDRITERLVSEAGPTIDVVVAAGGSFDTEAVAALDGALGERLERVSRLGAPTRTLFTGALGLGTPATPEEPVQLVPGSGGRFFVRAGAIDALTVVEAGDDDVDGLWISQRFAEEQSIEVGDVVGVEGSSTSLVVAGIHRDLWRDGRDAYWDSVPGVLVPRFSEVFGAPLFELFIVSGETADALGLSGTARFDIPVERPPSTLSDLRGLSSQLRAVERSFTRSDEIVSALQQFSGEGAAVPSLATELFDVEREAIDRSDELDQPIATTSIAGIALGLVVSMAGAGFVARRRHRELRLLRADGDPGWRFFARAGLEFALPGALAIVVGIAAGWFVIRLAGPTGNAVISDVRLDLAIACGVAGVLAAATVTSLVAVRTLEDRTPPPHRTLLRWLLPAVVLAAAAWVQVGAPDRGGDVDLLVVVFPIVGLVAGVGVAILLIQRAVSWRRRVGGGAPVALFLAWRRVVATEVGALAVAIVIGASFGLVMFPALLVESLDDAALAKATAVVGGPTNVQLVDELADPPARSTIILTQTTRTSIGGRTVAVQAIDSDTYARGVSWNRWFGSSADEVVETLRSAEETVDANVVPAVAVGERTIPDDGAFGTTSTFRYLVLDALDAAPLAASATPTLIVLADRVEDVALDRHVRQRPPDVDEAEWLDAYRSPLAGYQERLITDVPLAELEDRLEAEDVRYRSPASLETQLGSLDNQSVRWSFAYFVILAVTAAVAAAVGLLLYLGEQQSRRELGDAITRRMGLRSAVRLRASLVEVGSLAALAFSAGTIVAIVVARRIFGRFDPDPATAPDTDLRIAWPTLIGIVVAGAAVVVAVVLVVHLRARRRPLGEILRGS